MTAMESTRTSAGDINRWYLLDRDQRDRKAQKGFNATIDRGMTGGQFQVKDQGDGLFGQL